MKVVARISGENAALVDQLIAEGITAKLVRSAVIVELPSAEDAGWNEFRYVIPPHLKAENYTLMLDVEEEGGGMTNTGSGTVVAGLSGKALRPYYMPRSGHLACGTHAYFSVPGHAVTVTGYRRDSNVTIQQHDVVAEGNEARIVTKQLWSGEIDVLPNMFGRFQAAATAAQDKANCYHCREPHYIAE